jgi:cardiolipin synthase
MRNGTVGTLLWGALALVTASLSVVCAGHALLWKRDSRAALGWIGACFSLPLLGPTLYLIFGNRVRRTALQWAAAGRRLTGKGAFRASSAVALPAGSGTEHLAALRHLVDQVTHRVLMGGNRVVPLHGGEQAYPAMLEAIAGARHSVHLSSYIFDGDETGWLFANALAAAAARGVEVRLLVDGLGERYSRPSARRLLQRTAARIGRFLPLHRGGCINLRNHRKILVADGSVGFTGGMNIGDRHLTGRTSLRGPVMDVHFRVEGPVVADLQRVFLEDWFSATGELHDDPPCFPRIPAVGGCAARAIDAGPDEELPELHWVILGALACARRKVQIMTPYFIPDAALTAALGSAALRGVEVSLLLPGQTDLFFVDWATRACLWEILPFGIHVRYQPPPFVHTKLLLVDDLWSLVGSANLDPRSLRLNFELDLEIYDAATTGGLARHFDESFARSRAVTMDEVDGRSLPERLRDGAAKLLSPYL